MRAFSARAALADGRLALARGRQRLELEVRDIAAVEPWWLPIPCTGATLRLASGGRWHQVRRWLERLGLTALYLFARVAAASLGRCMKPLQWRASLGPG